MAEAADCRLAGFRRVDFTGTFAAFNASTIPACSLGRSTRSP